MNCVIGWKKVARVGVTVYGEVVCGAAMLNDCYTDFSRRRAELLLVVCSLYVRFPVN